MKMTFLGQSWPCLCAHLVALFEVSDPGSDEKPEKGVQTKNSGVVNVKAMGGMVRWYR